MVPEPRIQEKGEVYYEKHYEQNRRAASANRV